MTTALAMGLVAVLVASIVAEGSWSLAIATGTRRSTDFTPAFTPFVSEAEVEAIFGGATS